jgi:tRNA A-37 threonylcarbamoyl transferase component Bud32
MGTFWHISEQYTNTSMADAFSTLDHAFSIRGNHVTHSPISRLIKVKIEDRFYYVKLYTGGGKRLRRYVGRSRVRGEWENLLFFMKLGIPTANLVAYGHELRWGLFKRGALITEALPDTTEMAGLAREDSPLLKNRAWIRQVARQTADFTRRLHDKGFIHNDLKWRNILVTCGEKPRVFFIDCPLGKTLFGLKWRRGIAKDLACLDKVAKQSLSRTTRLWFYKIYSGHEKLTKVDKLTIRKVLAFFNGRE